MIQLDLTQAETETLVDVLKQDVSDLSFEIANTDSQDFREKLKRRKAALNRVVEMLTKGQTDRHLV